MTTFHAQAKGPNVKLHVPIPGTESPDFVPGCILERHSEAFASKVGITSAPAKKTEGGFWIEIKLLGGTLVGYRNGIAIGFTATAPESLPELPLPEGAEEGAEPPREVPQFAHQIPDSYMLGYRKALYWNGQRSDVELDTAQLAPLDSDKLGILMTNSGTIICYVNRLKRGEVTMPEGASPPSGDADLYGLVDIVGQACMVQVMDSYPPEEETDEMRQNQVRRDLRRKFKSQFGELIKDPD